MAEEEKNDILQEIKKFKEFVESPPAHVVANEKLMKSLTLRAETINILESNFLLSFASYMESKKDFDKDCTDSNYTEDDRVVLHGKYLSRSANDLMQKAILLIETAFKVVTTSLRDEAFDQAPDSMPGEINPNLNEHGIDESVFDNPELESELPEPELPDEFKEDIEGEKGNE